VEDATIQNVQGLSQLNRQLLLQRGAVGEPIHRLRDASKKVATMTSVVSQLKTTLDKAKEDPSDSTTCLTVEQAEQPFELEKDPLFQYVVASIVKIIQRHK
jgi:hypothetical protein